MNEPSTCSITLSKMCNLSTIFELVPNLFTSGKHISIYFFLTYNSLIYRLIVGSKVMAYSHFYPQTHISWPWGPKPIDSIEALVLDDRFHPFYYKMVKLFVSKILLYPYYKLKYIKHHKQCKRRNKGET